MNTSNIDLFNSSLKATSLDRALISQCSEGPERPILITQNNNSSELSIEDLQNYFLTEGFQLKILEKISPKQTLAMTSNNYTFYTLTELKQNHSLYNQTFHTKNSLNLSESSIEETGKAEEEENRRIVFINNFPYGTKPEELVEYFSCFGPIKSTFLSNQKKVSNTGSFVNGHVEFVEEKHADKLRLVDVLYFNNRKITIKQYLSKKRSLKNEKKRIFDLGILDLETPSECDDSPNIYMRRGTRGLELVKKIQFNQKFDKISMKFIEFKHFVEPWNLRMNC